MKKAMLCILPALAAVTGVLFLIFRKKAGRN